MPAPFPIASLNGQLLRLDEVRISWNDRGFLYGDGLFETIRVHSGRPFLWEWLSELFLFPGLIHKKQQTRFQLS